MEGRPLPPQAASSCRWRTNLSRSASLKSYTARMRRMALTTVASRAEKASLVTSGGVERASEAEASQRRRCRLCRRLCTDALTRCQLHETLHLAVAHVVDDLLHVLLFVTFIVCLVVPHPSIKTTPVAAVEVLINETRAYDG